MDQKLLDRFNYLKSLHLDIDMSRGKPSKEQLDLSNKMNDVLTSQSDYKSLDGVDVRNYGDLEGIKEARQLMGDVLGIDYQNVLVLGNSSLSAMYEQIARSFIYGVCGNAPWSKLEKVQWLCPIPGYDRHFAMLEHFGIEMISVPYYNDGPDMELIEALVNEENIKGIWIVPKFSNPLGITYSDEVIRRLARLKPAAKDFRIYVDNAYALHDFEGDVKLLNIYEEAKKAGNEDILYLFTSTSKLSFPGSGIAAIGASENNIRDITSHLKYQTISYDKINQLRHVCFFKNKEGLKSHALKHGQILLRKFKIVDEYLSKYCSDVAAWSTPKGGYFVTLKVKGNAKEVVARCKQCGVKLTEAGATHPYHNDPTNSYIRLAPSYLSEEDLRQAMEVICLSILLETE